MLGVCCFKVNNEECQCSFPLGGNPEDWCPVHGNLKRKGRHKHMTGNQFAKKKVATLQSKKEQAWNSIKQFPVDPLFVWRNAQGIFYLKHLATPHIFNALNRSMPNLINELLNRGFDRKIIKDLLTENLAKL